MIAITGIGMVTPLGGDTRSTWQALMNRESGIAPIEQFDASAFPTTIAAEVKNFSIPTTLDKKLLRNSVSFTRFAMAAADEAIQDAGIAPTSVDASRWGIALGSGMMNAEYDYWERFSAEFVKDGQVDFNKLHREGHEFFRPNHYGKVQVNSCMNLIAQQYNVRGFCSSVHTACASGGQAMGVALQALRRGDADVMIAGGFDSMINPFGLSSFCLLGALSTYNDTPETASRPFDLTRKGFVLGEGAAFLILETLEHAKARGAHIYACLAGEGNSVTGYRITDSHPEGDGPIQSIKNALTDAGAAVADLDYVNAHGTSTKMNDLGETNAMKAVFGEHAYDIPASSTKSQTGHLIAAAGALETAFTALSIHHQKIPSTANLTTPDPECDLDYVIDGPREKSIGVAMSNSFGFGGSNSSIVLCHPEWQPGGRYV